MTIWVARGDGGITRMPQPPYFRVGMQPVGRFAIRPQPDRGGGGESEVFHFVSESHAKGGFSEPPSDMTGNLRA
jgi:hypothetical protein